MKSPITYNLKPFEELNNEEISLVWKWRNDPKIRQWMYDKSEIIFENHLKFIDALKNNNKKKYWVVFRNNTPIGVSSIVNIENNTGEWGYYIGPEYHDENFGVEFYYYSLKFAFEQLGFDKLYGFALIENNRANSLNSLFGFTRKTVKKEMDDGTKDFYFMELYSNTWIESTKTNQKILRLLELTINKH